MCNVVYCVICTLADDDLLQLCVTLSAVRSHSLSYNFMLSVVFCFRLFADPFNPGVHKILLCETFDPQNKPTGGYSHLLMYCRRCHPTLPLPEFRSSLYTKHMAALCCMTTQAYTKISPAVSDRLTFHLALSRSAATCRCTCTCTLYMYMYCMYIVLVVAVHMYMYMYVPFRLKYSLL